MCKNYFLFGIRRMPSSVHTFRPTPLDSSVNFCCIYETTGINHKQMYMIELWLSNKVESWKNWNWKLKNWKLHAPLLSDCKVRRVTYGCKMDFETYVEKVVDSKEHWGFLNLKYLYMVLTDDTEIQYRNTIQKYDTEIRYRYTIKKYDTDIRYRNTIQIYNTDIWYR